MPDLERVGEGLDALLRRLGMPTVPDLERLAGEWAALAGEPWADRSRPVGFRDGVLLLEVPDGTSATLLRYQEASLLELLYRLGGKIEHGLFHIFGECLIGLDGLNYAGQ